MFIAALFIIAKRFSCSDEQRNKTWCIHTMEYYSAFKKKEILALAPTWMNLEDTVLNEVSHSQKNKCFMIPIV
jgi:hypothetical protein